MKVLDRNHVYNQLDSIHFADMNSFETGKTLYISLIERICNVQVGHYAKRNKTWMFFFRNSGYQNGKDPANPRQNNRC